MEPPNRAPVLLRAACLAALFSLASCSDDSDGPRDARRDLQVHQSLWNSRQVVDYQFVQRKSCFCRGDYREPMIVEVRGGVPVTVRRVEDGRLLPTGMAMTVDDVFDRIDKALDHDFEHLTVDYDPEMGFPMEASMDPGHGTADGFFDITCFGMTPLAAVEPCHDPAPDPPCHCTAEFPALAYRYTAYDANGRLTVEGCAVLEYTPDPETPGAHNVTGHRCFSRACGAHPDDAHRGTHDIRGWLGADGRISLDLNAGWADNNVYLTGTTTGSLNAYINGDWTYATIVGPVNRGTFLLDRIE